jgi:hypothetical protein
VDAQHVIDIELPFRAFLIGATVVFVLNYLWSIGMTSEDGWDDDSHTVFDESPSDHASATGKIFFFYLAHLLIFYAALLVRLRKKLKWHQTMCRSR